MGSKKSKKTAEAQAPAVKAKNPDYLWSMSYAPRLGADTHGFQLLPIILFSAISILLVHMYSYTRPMDQFYWSGGGNDQSDFFSHCKMVCIVIAAALALTMLLYRLCTQSLAIKRSYAYIPMAVYVVMVLISYACSEYKEFALWGYNDRFEGTMSLLAYMVMLFVIINFVNSEKNVKWILYPLFGSATLLGFLGLSQGLDHDFFRTPLGQKLITPNNMTDSGQTINQLIDEAAARGEQLLNFTFQNKEIYQTVYNINYVSFYLTLLLPLVGLLFIRSFERLKDGEAKWKPIAWGLLFALLIYNLIGSASSGGFFGMAIVVLLAFVVLNKKIIRWWKPVAILLVITAIVGGVTFDRWSEELGFAFKNASSDYIDTTIAEVPEENRTGHLDYFDTVDNSIKMSMDGKEISINVDGVNRSFGITDENGERIQMNQLEGDNLLYGIDTPEFRNVIFQPAIDENNSTYVIIHTNYPADNTWNFMATENGVLFRNDLGVLIDLDPIPSFGFEANPKFGNGRGYIWSRSFPLMGEAFFKGFGADTYCLVFPHDDYAGKYSTNFTPINIIVDKPHNMYIGAWVGTGGISVLALLALWFIYIAQSIVLYIRKGYEKMEFMDIVGVGIALGITGFIFTGFVDDSTVSTMPMFYTLLGVGYAVNALQKKEASL